MGDHPSALELPSISLSPLDLAALARSFTILYARVFVLPDRLKCFGADVRQMTATVLHEMIQSEDPVIATPKLPRTPHTMPR